MSSSVIEIKTKDGIEPSHFYHPPQGGQRPAVILYMDAFGVRPALCQMAERLAANGYYVLLPNLYYRSGPAIPFDPATAFEPGPEQQRLKSARGLINLNNLMEDTAAMLDFLQRQPGSAGQKIGCVGYCMGGGMALTAAGTFPDKIAAAASFHGARLATDQPDSPHLLAPKMRAAVYIGIGGLDAHFSAPEKQRLEAALQSARVQHTTEVYPNAKHGFAISDTLGYDKPASEHHWEQLLKLFAGNLSN